MRHIFSLIVLLGGLAACGADGPPERPSPGVTVTGDARFGVVIN